MLERLFLISILILPARAVSQVSCDSLTYSNDSLAVVNTNIFTGTCISHDRKIIIENYFNKGELDSVAFFKKGRKQSVETYCGEYSTVKFFHENGLLKKSISLKNDTCFGFWREYYKNGCIKYEAEYISDTELKNDVHYTWNRNGEKFMHYCIEISHTKKVGKLQFDSAYGKCKKEKVKQ